MIDAALAQVYRPHYLLTAADAAAPPRLLPPSGLLACNDGKPAKNLSYLDHALTLLAVVIFRIRASFAWRLPLFDHLVGDCEKRRRNFQAERIGGPQI